MKGHERGILSSRDDRDWLPVSANRLKAALLLANTVMESHGSVVATVYYFSVVYIYTVYYALIIKDKASLT